MLKLDKFNLISFKSLLLEKKTKKQRNIGSVNWYKNKLYNAYKINKNKAKNKIFLKRIIDRNKCFERSVFNSYFDHDFESLKDAVYYHLREYETNIKYKKVSYKKYVNKEVYKDITYKYERLFIFNRDATPPIEEVKFLKVLEYTNVYGRKYTEASILLNNGCVYNTFRFYTKKEAIKKYKEIIKETEKELVNRKKELKNLINS